MRSPARAAIFDYIEGWYNPRRRHSTLDYPSPTEFERQHAELAESALEVPIQAHGSVAGTPPRASEGLTTRRLATVGSDFAANGSIAPENALVVDGNRSRQDRDERLSNGGVTRSSLRPTVMDKLTEIQHQQQRQHASSKPRLNRGRSSDLLTPMP